MIVHVCVCGRLFVWAFRTYVHVSLLYTQQQGNIFGWFLASLVQRAQDEEVCGAVGWLCSNRVGCQSEQAEYLVKIKHRAKLSLLRKQHSINAYLTACVLIYDIHSVSLATSMCGIIISWAP